MGKNTGIGWCDHTFNPWWGCTEVSPGCANCYARAFAKRTGHGGTWGAGALRRTFGPAHWQEPLAWAVAARAAAASARVFCASMADWCDADAPRIELARLHRLIADTRWLDWLLLTKRTARIVRSLPQGWGQGWSHVWLGTSAEDPEQLERRAPQLAQVAAPVHFLSCEPLLAPLPNLHRHLAGIQWVILGGESDGARRCEPEWIADAVAQCQDAGVPVFVKQLGTWWARSRLLKGKGDNPASWPVKLRVRQHPLERRRVAA